jgi:DNA-binding GntR family transcriptional regulator
VSIQEATSRASDDRVLEPIEYRGLTLLALEALRGAILRRDFAPDEQLNFPKLSAQLGVSPTPLKEAARILAAQGVLEIRPRLGTYIKPITEQSLQETTEARLLIESFAVRRFPTRASKRDWQDLSRLLSQASDLVESMGQNPAPDSVAKWIELDSSFHRDVVAIGSNGVLFRFYESLGISMQLTRAIVYSASTGGAASSSPMRESHAEHLALFKDMKAGRPERAVERLEKHVTRSLKVAVAGIRARGGVV